jgi:hypothetical protein
VSERSRARSAAQLRLRGGAAHLVWPAGDATGVMVLLSGRDPEPLCRWLADALGVVALSAAARDGSPAIEWVADHAAEFGADGSRLILAGVHGAAPAVAALAVRARDDGWPRIAEQVFIHPRLDDPPTAWLAGVAPATVVAGDAGARTYVAALRRAGVPVHELDDLRELAGLGQAITAAG